MTEASQKLGVMAHQLQVASSAKAGFKLHETEVINAAKEIGLALRIYSGNHGNQYPTSFEQVTNELGGSLSVGGIDAYTFDLLSDGSARSDRPNMIELRERTPRQAPDGTWHRTYGLSDGSVQEAASYDGNFDAWEKENTYPPATNP